ncbi:MAG: hypothetical protein QXM22_06465, partial [Candidatus Bathyarchaeia archaeon]
MHAKNKNHVHFVGVYKKNKFITLLPIAIRQTCEALTMDLKSKLKIESLPIFIFLIFYVLAGVA